MGDRAEVEADTSVHALAAGDHLLLCSDGLCVQVEDEMIKQIVWAAATPQAACDALVEAANTAGGPDNISAVLVEVAQT